MTFFIDPFGGNVIKSDCLGCTLFSSRIRAALRPEFFETSDTPKTALRKSIYQVLISSSVPGMRSGPSLHMAGRPFSVPITGAIAFLLAAWESGMMVAKKYR